MTTKQIHVFISHSWTYSDHYEKLCEWVFEPEHSTGGSKLNFYDFSVPKHDPIHNANSTEELRDAIFNKIMRSHVVVIPTGMYSSYSKWIKKEIEGAQHYNKPILAVTPWAQERKSSVVVNNASESVGWNANSVVSGIYGLYSSL